MTVDLQQRDSLALQSQKEMVVARVYHEVLEDLRSRVLLGVLVPQRCFLDFQPKKTVSVDVAARCLNALLSLVRHVPTKLSKFNRFVLRLLVQFVWILLLRAIRTSLAAGRLLGITAAPV